MNFFIVKHPTFVNRETEGQADGQTYKTCVGEIFGRKQKFQKILSQQKL